MWPAVRQHGKTKIMPESEKRLLRFAKKNSFEILIVLVTLGGTFLRFLLWDIVSSDMDVYLRWYGRAEECGGIPGLYELGQRIKGYNAAFQFVIALLTHLPGDGLYKMKALWTAFDLLLATGLWTLVYELRGGKKAGERNITAFRDATAAYALCYLCPVVFLNSSAWGQSDSVYVALIVWSLVWLRREKYLGSFLLLGLSLAFKLQTVFILPFFGFYYLYKKSFSLLYFLALPGVFLASALPRQLIHLIAPIKAAASAVAPSAAASAQQAAQGLPNILTVYIGQISSGSRLCMEYPGFWSFLPDEEAGAEGFADFFKFRNAAIVFCFALLVMLLILFLKQRREANVMFLYSAFLLSFTTVFFLPCMLDRYGYLYEVLALALVFLDKRTIVPALSLHLIMSYVIAGRVGMEMYHVPMRFLGFLMMLVYAAYLYLFFAKKKEGTGNAGV